MKTEIWILEEVSTGKTAEIEVSGEKEAQSILKNEHGEGVIVYKKQTD